MFFEPPLQCPDSLPDINFAVDQETQKKLMESEHNLLTTQQQLTDNAVAIENLENKNSMLSEELRLHRQEREKIQQQLEKIRNRGILARIFNSEQ